MIHKKAFNLHFFLLVGEGGGSLQVSESQVLIYLFYCLLYTSDAADEHRDV